MVHRALTITLNQLEIFATVAREGSFTRAGKVLLRSEAAISQQIKLLEAAVGVRLLERSPGHPVRPTEAGRVMLASSDTVLKQLTRTLTELEGLRKLETGSVVVGSGPYFGSYLLPQICASFQKLAPGIGVHLSTARGEDLVDAVRRGEVELAIVGGEVTEKGVAQGRLAGKDVVWIAPDGHRLASRAAIPFREIAAENLILSRRSSSNRKALEHWAHAQGLEVRPSLEVGGAEAQVTAVRSGLGLAAVTSHVLTRYKDAPLRVLAVEGFPLRGSWSVVWRQDELSPAAALFKDHLFRQRAQIEATSLYAPKKEEPGSATA
jgi:LysR family transcriptional regulator, low CO2-responsive transcriptional regulator